MNPKALLLLPIAVILGCASPAFVPGVTGVNGVRVTQEISISSGKHTQALIGVLEMTQDRTALAVVSATGLFLFSIEDTQQTRKTERHADLPNFVDPQQILRDVQLVNWPDSALAQLLGSKVKFDDENQLRTVKRRHKAPKYVRYLPSRDTGTWQEAILTDRQHRYEIRVRTISRVGI